MKRRSLGALAYAPPRNLREAFQRTRAQCFVLSVIAVTAVVNLFGLLPAKSELIEWLNAFFQRFGPLAIAPISFVENLAGVNVYFPGSVTILVAMAYSAGEPLLALKTFIAITIASLAAHHLNFLAGRRLFKRGKRNIQGRRYGTQGALNVALASALWHPHFAALACIDLGSHGVKYSRFVLSHLPWFLLWNIFWGFSMYALGPHVIQDSKLWPLVSVLLVVWLLWDLFEFEYRKVRH